MSLIICTECGNEVRNPYEQFSERTEYRRLDCQERRASWTVRLVCRDCVDKLAARHKAGGDPAEQGSLL